MGKEKLILPQNFIHIYNIITERETRIDQQLKHTSIWTLTQVESGKQVRLKYVCIRLVTRLQADWLKESHTHFRVLSKHAEVSMAS